MAFAAANLYNMNSMPPGFAKYRYKSDTDVRATVETAGYFNNTDDLLNLGVDDEITVIGDEGGYSVVVASLSSGSVTTAHLRPGSPALVAGGATLTLTREEHDGKTMLWNTNTGGAFTLPLATGTGMKFRFVVSVVRSSGTYDIDCVGSDEFAGTCAIIDVDSADATILFAAETGDNFVSISMSGTTSGLGAVGDWVELEDIATAVWAVKGAIHADGTVITPFTT